jgi:hypothetical protein
LKREERNGEREREELDILHSSNWTAQLFPGTPVWSGAATFFTFCCVRAQLPKVSRKGREGCQGHTCGDDEDGGGKQRVGSGNAGECETRALGVGGIVRLHAVDILEVMMEARKGRGVAVYLVHLLLLIDAELAGSHVDKE